MTGCAQKQYHTHLTQLRHLSQKNVVFKSGALTSNIRVKALDEAALSVAAQASLNVSALAIDARLKRNAKRLDATYNFTTLMLEKNVLPPVLVSAQHTLTIENGNSIRVADKTYKIIKQARFVTASPTWRDYLWMNYPKPEPPDATLLPKNEAEQKVWRAAIDRGWKHGAEQASTIFKSNMARLQRDYSGMILYRKLLAEHMVSAPYVAKSELGITGSGSDMRINDKILRITVLPSLNAHSSTWTPALIHNGEQ